MYKYLVILMISLLLACTGRKNSDPIKFVNRSIPAEESDKAFEIDGNECNHKILRDRPYVYQECHGYDPAMKKVCRNKNEERLRSFKKRTMKLFKRCLEKKGWEESTPIKHAHGSIEIVEQTAPAYPAEAVPLCVEGKVKVRFTITKDGTVKDAIILEAQPERVFNTSVLNAVSTWRFKAILANGELMEQQDVVQNLVFKPHEQCTQEIDSLVK